MVLTISITYAKQDQITYNAIIITYYIFQATDKFILKT